MRAAEGVILHRTDGNDDPLLVILSRKTDSGIVLVPDSATVVMEVLNGTSYITINGTAKGDSSGTFLFETTTIPAGASELCYDIDVTEGGVKATYARGVIKTATKVGT